MAHIKVRFVLNKGRHGAPLSKLGKISEQIDKFLRALSADSQIEVRPGEWLAANFKNGSVEYDAEFQGDVSPASAQIFTHNLERLADYDPEHEGLNAAISETTALEYARIGSHIEPGEEIGLGIYPLQGRKPLWRSITYSKTAVIRRQIETPIPSFGSVQGILHAWFKEAREPNFQMRELSTDALVRVYYTSGLYADVADAVRERTSILLVSGNMLFDRATRSAVELRAERIKRMKALSSADFEAFFGSAPEFESDLTSDTGVDG